MALKIKPKPKKSSKPPEKPRRASAKLAQDPNQFRGLGAGDRVATPDNENGVVVSTGSGNRELFSGQPYVVVRFEESGSLRDETYPVAQVRKARVSRKRKARRALAAVEGTSVEYMGEPGEIIGSRKLTVYTVEFNDGGVESIPADDPELLVLDESYALASRSPRRSRIQGRKPQRRRLAAPEPNDPARADFDALYERTVERYEDDPQIDAGAVEQAVEKAWGMEDPLATEADVDNHVDVFLGKQTRREATLFAQALDGLLRCPACSGKVSRLKRNPNHFICEKNPRHVSELEFG